MFRKYPPFLMTLAPETPGGSGGQDNEFAEAEQDTTAATATEDSNEDEVDVDDGEDNVEWTRNVHGAFPRASGKNLIVRVARNR